MSEPEQQNQERNYIAFISYRHKPLDKEAAERIQRSIESYTVPKELRARFGASKLGLVFRDEDELPAASSLSDSITYALDHTQYLIVICTPDLPKSRWCEQEIRYFLQTHDRAHLLAVLVDGEPEQSFSPWMLHEFDDAGNILRDTEPLAANIAGANHTIDRRAFRKEIVRLYAAVMGCPFDELWQRQKRARTNRLMALTGVAAALMAIFLGTVLVKNRQITKQNEQITAQNEQILGQNEKITAQNEQITAQNDDLQTQMSSILVTSGLAQQKDYAVKDALQSALQAMQGEPRYWDPRVEKLLCDGLSAYQWKQKVTEVLYELPLDVVDLAADDAGGRALLADSTGVVRCINVEDGALLWEAPSWQTGQEMGSADTRLSMQPDAGLVLVKNSGNVCALRLEDGSVAWNYTYPTGAENLFWRHDAALGRVALIHQVGYQPQTSYLVFLDAKTGAELGQADLSPEDADLEISSYDRPEAVGMAYSDDGAYFAVALKQTYAEDTGKDPALAVFLVDPKTGEIVKKTLWEEVPLKVNWRLCGIHVDPNGDIYLQLYYYMSAGIYNLRFPHDGSKPDVSFVNHTPSDMTGFKILLEASLRVHPALYSDHLILVCSDRSVFVFDKADLHLAKPLEFTSEVKSISWLDRDEERVQIISASGEVAIYDLGHKDNKAIESYSNFYSDQTQILLACPVRGGVLENPDEGMYLTVLENQPNRLLRLRSKSDLSFEPLKKQPPSDLDTTLSIAPSPDGAVLYSFCRHNGLEVTRLDPETLEELDTTHLDGSFYSGFIPFDQTHIIQENKIYGIDGSVQTLEAQNVGWTWRNVACTDGSVLTACDGTDGYRPTLTPFWLSGEPVETSLDPETGLYMTDSDLFALGTNGCALALGLVYDAQDQPLTESPVYVLYDVRTGEKTLLDDPCPDAEDRIVALGNVERRFAVADAQGRLVLGSASDGSAQVLEDVWQPGEIVSLAFSQDDRYLVVCTGAGRVDCLDLTDLSVHFRQYLDWSKAEAYNYRQLLALHQPEQNRLQILVGTQWGPKTWVNLRTDAWVQTAEAAKVYLAQPDQARLFVLRGDKLGCYPIHTVEDLTALAEAELP